MAGSADNVTAGPERSANRRSPVVLIGGATASGKSAVALDIADAFDGVVINADSMQVYRELCVVTARPGPDDIARAPHRLYGELSGREGCSVGKWLALASAAVDEAVSAGRLPILVGGTGLYLRAFVQGLAEIPDVPPDVLAEATALLDAEGARGLYARLQDEDPASAMRLSPNDPQRILRAWTVHRHTGRSIVEWQADGSGNASRHPTLPIVLLPDRAGLYERCDQRFAWMVDHGAVEEVAALLAMQFPADRPVMKAVGVPEIAAFLDGHLSRSDMIAKGQQATRRYAKRQFTWFRHQMAGAEIFATQYSKSLRQKIFSKIRNFC